ncbi:TIM21-domain-containing protein, partial [Haematococcus lacustris]
DSFELTTERISALTDKIPQRPVGVVEGTSYSIIILAAFGVLAYLVYMFVLNFIMEPTALQCFNHTLDVLKADPRITVRLGASDDIRAWGSNSSSRVARQQIPHQIYKDAQGQEHVRVQFYMKGPSGTGLVNADMYRDTAGQWQYTYLLMDVYTASSSNPSRLYIVKPQ